MHLLVEPGWLLCTACTQGGPKTHLCSLQLQIIPATNQQHAKVSQQYLLDFLRFFRRFVLDEGFLNKPGQINSTWTLSDSYV